MSDHPEHRTFRIAVDARPLAEPSGGFRRYLEGLLPAVLDADPEIELTLITNREPDPSWRERDRVELSVAPWPMTALLRPLWERRQLPKRLAESAADLFFSSSGIVPPGSSFPSAVVVHDLTFLKRPELLPWRYRRYWRGIAAGWPSAASVLVPSTATRNDLLARTDVEGRRVHVIPHAADARFRPFDPASRPGHDPKPEIDGPFVLWVGTREPRKNLPLLIEAMELLNSGRTTPIPLAVVGRRGWGEPELRSLPWLRVLGNIADEALVDLYRATSVFAFPSSDEGFGLPCVEAMACGAPVLVADAGSLPEIIAGAGRVLPTNDAQAWARAIAEVVDDPGTASRLGGRSLTRAADFSWDATARQSLDVFRRTVRP